MQLTPTRVMPQRRAAGGRNPRPIKTTDEVRFKMPYVLICSDTHKNWPIKTCSGSSFLAELRASSHTVQHNPELAWGESSRIARGKI